jgi:hypothetical protein
MKFPFPCRIKDFYTIPKYGKYRFIIYPDFKQTSFSVEVVVRKYNKIAETGFIFETGA